MKNDKNITVGSILGAVFSPRNCFNFGAGLTRVPVSAVTEVALRTTAPVTGTALGLVAGVGMGLAGGVINAFKPSEQRGAEMTAALTEAKIAMENARVEAAKQVLAQREALAARAEARVDAAAAKTEAKAADARIKAADTATQEGLPTIEVAGSKVLKTQIEIAGQPMAPVPAGAAA